MCFHHNKFLPKLLLASRFVTDTEMSLPQDPNRIIQTHGPFKILPSKRAPTNQLLLLGCVFNPHHTQLHLTTFICVCSQIAPIIPFVLNHTFNTDVVYKFIVKSEISYYFLQVQIDKAFYFPSLSPIRASSVVERRIW